MRSLVLVSLTFLSLCSRAEMHRPKENPSFKLSLLTATSLIEPLLIGERPIGCEALFAETAFPIGLSSTSAHSMQESARAYLMEFRHRLGGFTNQALHRDSYDDYWEGQWNDIWPADRRRTGSALASIDQDLVDPHPDLQVTGTVIQGGDHILTYLDAVDRMARALDQMIVNGPGEQLPYMKATALSLTTAVEVLSAAGVMVSFANNSLALSALSATLLGINSFYGALPISIRALEGRNADRDFAYFSQTQEIRKAISAGHKDFTAYFARRFTVEPHYGEDLLSAQFQSERFLDQYQNQQANDFGLFANWLFAKPHTNAPTKWVEQSPPAAIRDGSQSFIYLNRLFLQDENGPVLIIYRRMVRSPHSP